MPDRSHELSLRELALRRLRRRHRDGTKVSLLTAARRQLTIARNVRSGWSGTIVHEQDGGLVRQSVEALCAGQGLTSGAEFGSVWTVQVLQGSLHLLLDSGRALLGYPGDLLVPAGEPARMVAESDCVMLVTFGDVAAPLVVTPVRAAAEGTT